MRGAILRFTEVHSRVLRDHTHLRTHASASLAQFTALVDGDLCAGLGVHVEDYSKWFLLDDVVVRSLEYINDYMSLPKCGEIGRAFLSTFVNDLLIFGCVTISKTIDERPNTLHPGQYTFEKEMNRMYVQVLSGEMMGACLSELCFCLVRRPSGVNLNGASLLSRMTGKDINTEQYTSDMPIDQRMLLVSLCNLSLHLRSSLLSLPLFSRIRSSPNLLAWMLACSGSDEQYFLNTCDTVSLIARHSTICSLLVLARTVLREIRSESDMLSDSEPAFPSIWPSAVPSISKEAEQLFDNIESQASQLLLLDPPTSSAQQHDTESQNQQDQYLESQIQQELFLEPHKTATHTSHLSPDQYITKLFKLTKEWNHAMQVLSSVFSPSSPIVLTRKPFSERWHLSALVMYYARLQNTFQANLRLRQELAPRTNSSFIIEKISQIRPHLYHTFRTQVTPYEDNCIFNYFAEHVRESEPKEQSKLLKILWKKTIRRGGILFSSREYVSGVGWIGHLNVLFGGILPTNNYVPDGADDAEDFMTEVRKKIFLIADPEISNFKVLTFLQMFEILCNEKYNFNLLDVGKVKY